MHIHLTEPLQCLMLNASLVCNKAFLILNKKTDLSCISKIWMSLEGGFPPLVCAVVLAEISWDVTILISPEGFQGHCFVAT